MDFNLVFITVFTTVYRLYFKIKNLIFRTPLQLFTYNQDEKKIYVTGYLGNKLIKMSIDFFELSGTYLIQMNNKSMRCFINGVLESSDSDVTYVVGNNFIQLQEDTKIDITDEITDEKVTKLLKKGQIVDFKLLIDKNF